MGFILILGMQLWWAPIVFVVASIPSFIISYRFGKKRYDVDKDMTKIDRKAWYISGILTSRDTIEERYMYGYTDKMNDEYKAKYEMARIARRKVTKSLWGNTTVAGMLTFISGVIVVAILIFSVITPNATQNTTSVSMFIALLGAILGLSQYVQDTIPDYIYSFRYKFEYLKELNEFLKFEGNEDATCLPSINKFFLESIEFKNVSFKYPECEAYILKNFNVKLNAGKHYAIVGVTGWYLCQNV